MDGGEHGLWPSCRLHSHMGSYNLAVSAAARSCLLSLMEITCRHHWAAVTMLNMYKLLVSVWSACVIVVVLIWSTCCLWSFYIFPHLASYDWHTLLQAANLANATFRTVLEVLLVLCHG